MSSRQPFRFLNLPAELRYMVYEAIETTVRKEELKFSDWDDRLPDETSVVMLRGGLQMSILTTCRLVNQEASPIMARKIQTISNEPMRFIMDWEVAVDTPFLLYLVFDTSPEAVSELAQLGGSLARFITSCRSYHMAASDTLTLNTSVPRVEFTFTSTAHPVDQLNASCITTFLVKLCCDFGVTYDAFFNTDSHGPASLVRARHYKDPSGVTTQDLTEVEWAEHTRKLEDLEKAAHKARY